MTNNTVSTKQEGCTKRSRSHVFIAFFCLAALQLSSLSAQKASEIITKLENNQVYDTARFEVTLSVSNRFGVTGNSFTSYSRKGGDTLIEITAGPDRGQKVLRQKTNIYLFYPDAEEVIWLKGSALKDSMMGSDFSYEDLTNDRTILDRYTVILEGTETVYGIKCYRLTLSAKTKNETYAKQTIWVDPEYFVTRRALLYSASGKALREMTASDIHTIAGKNLPYRTLMKDLLKKNTSTEMIITKAEIGIPLGEKYFNREELSW